MRVLLGVPRHALVYLVVYTLKNASQVRERVYKNISPSDSMACDSMACRRTDMASPHIQAHDDPTLTLYTGQEEQAPDIWGNQYVDVWLLLEVTAEDEGGEPVRAKLRA